MTSYTARLVGFTFTAPMMAAAALLMAGPAGAQSIDDSVVKSVTVSYADLNLAQDQGAQTMFQRIKHAAATVCGAAPGLRELRADAAYEQCRKDAVSHAIAKLNATLVTQLADAGQPAGSDRMELASK